jgi:hypothetical protein
MDDPGLDRHEWESEWEALAPLLQDSPADVLPELDDLVARMMVARGYPVTDELAPEAADPDVVAEFLEARRIARLGDEGATLDPGDVGAAVTAYRSLYQYLLELGPPAAR